MLIVHLSKGGDVFPGDAVLLEEASNDLHAGGDLGPLRRVLREHLLRGLWFTLHFSIFFNHLFIFLHIQCLMQKF